MPGHRGGAWPCPRSRQPTFGSPSTPPTSICVVGVARGRDVSMARARHARPPGQCARLPAMQFGVLSHPEPATAVSGSSFYAAMRVLPAQQRRAMFAIYAFCRAVDDVADGHEDRQTRLAEL